MSHSTEPTDVDIPIRATDNDAALARLSAVQKHYLEDPFISALVPRAHLQPPRPPLINIGTYLRGQGLDELVHSWIALAAKADCADGGKVQIISFGAGSDTRFWRLATGPHASRLAKYIELDFPEITTKKAMAIRKSKILSAGLGSPDSVSVGGGGTTLRSPVYNLFPVDLRLPPSTSIAPILASSSDPVLSPNLPTLLLFECVLVYMPPAASDALIQWFTDYISKTSTLGSIVYEMFGLGDPFGRVMLNNLKSRNVCLPGAGPYPNVPSLPQRYLRLNFTTAQALTLRQIRSEYVEKEELERLSRLEMLDEVEELELLSSIMLSPGPSKFRMGILLERDGPNGACIRSLSNGTTRMSEDCPRLLT
ncbi:hypothetical protein EW146_g6580 [Bondarzewia mesenterica]|uniref:Leucine carboxyl methyltransferase 1 n=1 Tax=Bondarzewia mesenterica TaxID=1095465 RepID=A0A4V3XEH6_9AGAM|nr:hypothetical protein EW146_g6580 [Bondarzewia mesenterica]